MGTGRGRGVLAERVRAGRGARGDAGLPDGLARQHGLERPREDDRDERQDRHQLDGRLAAAGTEARAGTPWRSETDGRRAPKPDPPAAAEMATPRATSVRRAGAARAAPRAGAAGVGTAPRS
jgi:hypothetical protein